LTSQSGCVFFPICLLHLFPKYRGKKMKPHEKPATHHDAILTALWARVVHGNGLLGPLMEFTTRSPRSASQASQEKGLPFLTCSEGFLHDQSLHILSLCAAFSFLTRASRCLFCQRASRPSCDYCQGLARLFLFNVLSIQKGIYRSGDSSNNPGCDCLSIDFCQSSKNFITASYLSIRTRS
jgi:hypothetical protein